MGYQSRGIATHAVVYMTNKDAYNLSEDSLDTLLGMLMEAGSVGTLKIIDTKSGAETFIFLKHISSIVVRGSENER